MTGAAKLDRQDQNSAHPDKRRGRGRRYITRHDAVREFAINKHSATQAIGDGPTEDRLPIAVVILLIGIFGLTQGLCYPLFSLILQRQGVDSALIGLSSGATPVGMIAFAPLLPAATRWLGSAGIALACTVTIVALLALMGLVQNVWFWFPARFLLGFGISGLYVTSETWINVMGPARIRGRLMGIFATSLSLGFAVGPFVLIGTGSAGWPPFLAGIGIGSAAAVLLAIIFRRLPDLGRDEGGSILGFVPLAPALLAIVGIVAAFDQALLSLFPVYGAAKGLSEREIAAAITVWAAGNILFQVPIGWLADRWSRRSIMVLLCVATTAGSILLPFTMASPWLLCALLFVWGPSSYGVYTLAIIELGSRFRGTMLLAGNSAFAVMWGLGGMTGPPAVGLAIDRTGPDGFSLGLAAIYLALLVLVLLRRTEP